MSTSWSPFKGIFSCTQDLITKHKDDNFLQTKSLLNSHKSHFISLLRNAPKSVEDERKVKESNRTGLAVNGDPTPTPLDDGFITDALVLSNFLQLNEISSVELLLAAEQQKCNYLQYGRCLVSILMYWDGRRNLVASLRNLILCRKGQTWSFNLPDYCEEMVTAFTDEVKENGMVKRILDLLKEIKVEAEMEKIDQSPHLKGVTAKYLTEVKGLVEQVRLGLAECLFYFSAQSGLECDEIASIVMHLRGDSETDLTYPVMSSSSIALLFAVLYSITMSRDDYENGAGLAGSTSKQHAIISNHDFLPRVHKLMTEASSEWKDGGILSVLQFFWSLTIARVLTLNIASPPIAWNNVVDQEEAVLDAALAGNVFGFLKDKVVASDYFRSEEFYVRSLHGAITDLVRLMPLKTKAIRNRGDEQAMLLHRYSQQQQQDHSNSADAEANHFQNLMELIGSLYGDDPLNLELSLEYWCSNNDLLGMGSASVSFHHHRSRLNHTKPTLLYKFVRSCGEQLPAMLCASYVRMINGLASGKRSAQKAFEMLRLNGDHHLAEENGLISWDKFFYSCQRYYTELREKIPQNHVFGQQNTSAVVNISAQSVRLIMSHEVEALRAFMKLIATICKHDEVACKLFYEHNKWATCEVLFGLLQCPVPIMLKADTLDALSELATSSDVVPGLIQMTQNAQLLTSSYTFQSKQTGLVAELEDIETKGEEYPMTRSFLKFLLSISSSFSSTAADPSLSGLKGSSLASGNVYPMNDYLTYVIDIVFTKALTRSYLRTEEQWQVIGACMKIFVRILENYSPLNEDLRVEKRPLLASTTTNHSPGYKLLMHTYTEGNFFRMVMKIIRSCLEYLELYKKDEKLEGHLVNAAQSALDFILIALDLRDSFFNVIRESKQNMLMAGLDKLLLAVNPGTGKSDYIVDVASLIVHNSTQVELSMQAVKTISHLCNSSAVNQRDLLMALVTSCHKQMLAKIVQGFVEILDLPCNELGAPSDELTKKHRICQEYIIRLLMHCSDQPHPNLALLLLGFDFGTSPIRTNLQDPGIFGSPRTCLHSIMSILTCGGVGEQPACVESNPTLAHLCYNLVYKLCANPETSSSVLRYLRSSYDFFMQHLQCLPFTASDERNRNEIILQQAWFMKCLSIEIFSLINNQQRGNVERIIQCLLNMGDKMMMRNTTTSVMSSRSMMVTDHTSLMRTFMSTSNMLNDSTFLSTHNMSRNSTTAVAGVKRDSLKLLQIVNQLQLTQEYPSPLVLDQFVNAPVEEAIKKCETTNSQGLAYCDVKALHALLEESLNSLNNADELTRKSMAIQDVAQILRNVVERNEIGESVFSKLLFLNAWKELFEISIQSTDTLPRDHYEQLLLCVATNIIGKVGSSSQELTSVFATCILSIFTAVRNLMSSSQTDDDGKIVRSVNSLKPTFAASLKIIIQGVIEWLIQPGIREGIRVYLYASVLCYLNICSRPAGKQNEVVGSLLASSNEDVYTRMSGENISLLKKFGDNLIGLLCKDACDGHIVARTLSFALMDAIVQIDSNQTWIDFINRNGYLNNIAISFGEEFDARNSQAVYVYQQKMALLCSIAQSCEGARAVLDCRVLWQVLCECRYLDARPHVDDADPSKLSAFRQLTFPALQLCTTILASLGGRFHDEASKCVLEFLISHNDSLISPLFDNELHYEDESQLVEWKLMTSLLCQIPDQYFKDDVSITSSSGEQEIYSYLLRIQRQIISSLPKIFLSEKQMFELKEQLQYSSKNENSPSYDTVCSLLDEIASNILAYIRVFTMNSSDEEFPCLYFTPDLSEKPTLAVGSDYQKATMGSLIGILRNSLKRYQQLKETNRNQQDKKNQMRCLHFIIENCVLLLWQHMEYFVLRYVPPETKTKRILYPDVIDRRDLYGDSSGRVNSTTVHVEELEKFKSGLSTCLSSSGLLKQLTMLSAPVEADAAMQVSLIPALTRRIQRIVNIHAN